MLATTSTTYWPEPCHVTGPGAAGASGGAGAYFDSSSGCYYYCDLAEPDVSLGINTLTFSGTGWRRGVRAWTRSHPTLRLSRSGRSGPAGTEKILGGTRRRAALRLMYVHNVLVYDLWFCCDAAMLNLAPVAVNVEA